MRISRQPDLVLFDLDDTLCDYGGARVTRLRIAFGLAEETAGRTLDAPMDDVVAESIRIQPHGVDHFPDLLSRHGIACQEAAEAAVRWYVRNRFHGLQLFPDAIETLEVVRAAHPGRRIGMVTNGPADVQSAKIDLLGLRPYFEFCLVSDEFGFWKPDREIFLEALRLGEAAAVHSIMIGDSPDHDMLGAESTGIPTVWMNRHDHAWPAPIPPPTWIARDLADVRRLLGHSERLGGGSRSR
ncbi:MAG: HAD family hydrolase [Thermomicrobiales bacterium]|nr:HAD family hydrolase [Thermomicrobiales bacterium]MCO5220074.1 HAD family hydrolase [Thermomicrobiales bacterium]